MFKVLVVVKLKLHLIRHCKCIHATATINEYITYRDFFIGLTSTCIYLYDFITDEYQVDSSGRSTYADICHMRFVIPVTKQFLFAYMRSSPRL